MGSFLQYVNVEHRGRTNFQFGIAREYTNTYLFNVI